MSTRSNDVEWNHSMIVKSIKTSRSTERWRECIHWRKESNFHLLSFGYENLLQISFAPLVLGEHKLYEWITLDWQMVNQSSWASDFSHLHEIWVERQIKFSGLSLLFFVECLERHFERKVSKFSSPFLRNEIKTKWLNKTRKFASKAKVSHFREICIHNSWLTRNSHTKSVPCACKIPKTFSGTRHIARERGRKRETRFQFFFYFFFAASPCATLSSSCYLRKRRKRKQNWEIYVEYENSKRLGVRWHKKRG